MPHGGGLAAGTVLGMSVGLGATSTSAVGALLDAFGPRAALWARGGPRRLALVLGRRLTS